MQPIGHIHCVSNAQPLGFRFLPGGTCRLWGRPDSFVHGVEDMHRTWFWKHRREWYTFQVGDINISLDTLPKRPDLRGTFHIFSSKFDLPLWWSVRCSRRIRRTSHIGHVSHGGTYPQGLYHNLADTTPTDVIHSLFTIPIHQCLWHIALDMLLVLMGRCKEPGGSTSVGLTLSRLEATSFSGFAPWTRWVLEGLPF